jgi:hypothetical protein
LGLAGWAPTGRDTDQHRLPGSLHLIELDLAERLDLARQGQLGRQTEDESGKSEAQRHEISLNYVVDRVRAARC